MPRPPTKRDPAPGDLPFRPVLCQDLSHTTRPALLSQLASLPSNTPCLTCAPRLPIFASGQQNASHVHRRRNRQTPIHAQKGFSGRSHQIGASCAVLTRRQVLAVSHASPSFCSPGLFARPFRNLHHRTEVALACGAGAGGRLLIVERWRGISL